MLVLLAVFAAFFAYSFADGYATQKKGGITTAPGDLENASGQKETCAKCHNGNPYNSSLEIRVQDANGHDILGYDPGASYTIKLIIHAATGTPAGYGFQMVGLKDNGDVGLQDFPGHSANVKEVNGILGRKYFEHNQPSTSNVFTIDWVAPPAGSGSVTFYAVGNAVNLNGNQGGDSPCKKKMTLTEGLILANDDPDTGAGISVMDAPATNRLRLRIQAAQSGRTHALLYDLNGRPVQQQTTQVSSGENEMTMDVSSLSPGLYILTVNTGVKRYATKVLILR